MTTPTELEFALPPCQDLSRPPAPPLSSPPPALLFSSLPQIHFPTRPSTRMLAAEIFRFRQDIFTYMRMNTGLGVQYLSVDSQHNQGVNPVQCANIKRTLFGFGLDGFKVCQLPIMGGKDGEGVEERGCDEFPGLKFPQDAVGEEHKFPALWAEMQGLEDGDAVWGQKVGISLGLEDGDAVCGGRRNF